MIVFAQQCGKFQLHGFDIEFHTIDQMATENVVLI